VTNDLLHTREEIHPFDVPQSIRYCDIA